MRLKFFSTQSDKSINFKQKEMVGAIPTFFFSALFELFNKISRFKSFG